MAPRLFVVTVSSISSISSTSQTSMNTPAARTTRSSRTTRTRTGCLTCRLRRKKCTEQKPTCDGCHRNSLICSWPASLVNANMIQLPSRSQRTGVPEAQLPIAPRYSQPLSMPLLLQNEMAQNLWHAFIHIVVPRCVCRPGCGNPTSHISFHSPCKITWSSRRSLLQQRPTYLPHLLGPRIGLWPITALFFATPSFV